MSLAIGGGEVWLSLVELPAEADLLHQASAALPEAELARCELIVDPQRRSTFVLARALTRLVLAKHLGVQVARVQITRAPDGRPLLDPRCGLSFSVSHSGRWVAVAVSSLPRIGVDIESAARTISPRLERRVLSQRELELRKARSLDRREAFLTHWTIKEACAKVLGGGLARNLRRLEVCDAYGVARLRDRDLADVDVMRWLPRAGLIGALAVSRGER